MTSQLVLRAKNVNKGGLPADAVTLQDKANVFGMRRKDTLEVVIAAGTAMVQDGSDPRLWEYTFDSPIAGVTYEWVARIVFGSDVYYAEFEKTASAEASCDAMLSISEVDAILAAHVLSTNLADWTDLSAADKGILICRAQAMIDAGRWDGTLYDADQAYSFPRKDSDGNLIGVDNDADPDSPLAPLRVREGLALLAFSFVHRPDAWEGFELRISGGLASHSAGGIAKAYQPRTGASDAREALRLIPDVWTRLAPFWFRGGHIV